MEKEETVQADKPDVTREELRRALAYVGSIKTPKKSAASAANGKKGGRPLKPLAAIPCTCGRGDAMEGHPTTCPRGLAIRRRANLVFAPNTTAEGETEA